MLEGLSLATHVIQGYVENGEVIAAAMIETQELIDYLKTTPEKNLTIRTNRFDNNEFLVITWDELEKDGCEIVYL